MKTIRLCALLLGCACAPLRAAPASGPSSVFEGATLFDLEAASDPQISPDGSRIAYVRRSNDIMTDRTRSTIWMIDTGTGMQTPLVAGSGSHFSPRWSRDGARLAYVSAVEGAGPQLFVRWLTTGQTARVTGLPDSPSAISWSPDDSQIAYVMSVPGEGRHLGTAPARPAGAKWADGLELIDQVTYRVDGAGYLKPGFDHIFLVSADGGASRQLSFGDFNDSGPLSWTPDGRTILFSANRSADWERNFLNTDVFALDVANGDLVALTKRAGPDNGAVVSPDGKHIAYLGYDDAKRNYEDNELYVMDIDGSAAHVLPTKLSRSIDTAWWASDSRTIYVTYDDHASKRLARIGLDGSVTKLVDALAGASNLDRPYTGGEFSVSRNGVIAYTGGSAQRPPDIYLTTGGQARRLTRLNETALGGKTLAAVRPLSVKAPDGRSIDAWLAIPPGRHEGERLPLILEIHGGPAAAYGPTFSTDVQLYAAHGYAVLYTNPRGSTSYGEDFANLVDHHFPSGDYDDLIAAVDAAIADGIADPDNLFVTGGSGGGILSTWIVGKTRRFKAAAAQKPVSNWLSGALTTDFSAYTVRNMFDKAPWEDPMGYWNLSPLSLVGNVTTPTLLVVGSEDFRTPASEAEQYYAALQIRGVPTALLKVPGAGHGSLAGRPSQSAARVSAILAWFDRYRTNKPVPAAN